ncbi:MAG TPA: hypothetical protein VGO34_13810 [Alphaproteobacteria bacterium]|jgi:hypothetical protein
MYLAGNQLFSNGELRDWLAERLEQAKAFVMSFTTEEFKRSDMLLESAVMSRFRVPEVHLIVEECYFVDEKEMTVAEANLPMEGQPVEGAVPLPPDTKLKAVTIAIPFQGPHQLLTMRPNVFSAHQPEAEVRGQELIVDFVAPLAVEDHIENRFQQHIALIERTLEVTQWQAMDFNTDLPMKVRALIRQRRAEVRPPTEAAR